MRRLRVLSVIPLVAGLLFAGAATTAAQSGVPVIPGASSMGDLPYVDAGFPCEWPRKALPTAPIVTDGIGATDDSFVFLMNATQPVLPSLPGALMGQGMDLNFMKCFFHYRSGIEGPSRMEKNFYCAYSSAQYSPTTSGQQSVYHVFEHSTLIIRDEFAILLCWGTSSCQAETGANSQICCDAAPVANDPQICQPGQGSSTTSTARRTAAPAARPASRTVDRRLR